MIAARVAIVLLALVALAAPASAKTLEYHVYLHDDPLHMVVNDLDGNFVEELRVQPGDEVRMNVHNDGSAPHRIVACADAPDDTEDCAKQWAFTPLLQPGDAAPLSFVASEEGTFDIYCNVPGHKGKLGSVGSMRVQMVVGDGGAGDDGGNGIPAPALVGVAGALAAAALLRRRA